VPIHTSWLPMRQEEPILQWSSRYIGQCYDRVELEGRLFLYRQKSSDPCAAGL